MCLLMLPQTVTWSLGDGREGRSFVKERIGPLLQLYRGPALSAVDIAMICSSALSGLRRRREYNWRVNWSSLGGQRGNRRCMGF